ncbi:MAG: polysaccharide deacetylase family protein [Tannerellaceae bacterium]|jgi:hypothetical protein|nr:polysaccharide deacetylase family protein [Tannerellaceae bacterium]
MKSEAIHYILGWLAGGEAGKWVGYTEEQERFGEYKVVIVPSGKFGQGLPPEPLQEIEGVPLLFGREEIIRVEDTIVVYADIVASTFFLISRYEEILRRDERDEHGRFPGRASLPYRAGFIHRPVVDEYGLLLRKWLREAGVPLLPEPTRLNTLYLTHDVDAPFLYRSWKGFGRSLLEKRGLGVSLRGKFGAVAQDPWYTFPKFFCWDKELYQAFGEDHCKVIYFFKAGGSTLHDKPHYRLSSSDIHGLLRKVKEEGATIGLHASYQAGIHPRYIAVEKAALEEAIQLPVSYNRHHFLAVREPEHFEDLEKAGITDDFTMGYADVAGYRLGTSRPVRWIDPLTYRLSALTLHPLTAMDGSLTEAKYMSLDDPQAAAYCLQLASVAGKVGGDVCFLWHNSSPLPLYRRVLQLVWSHGI